MDEDEIIVIVKSILLDSFDIPIDNFSWDEPLEYLNDDFGILGVMLDFEKLLQQQINQSISILNYIDPTFNTPRDIIDLIKK